MANNPWASKEMIGVGGDGWYRVRRWLYIYSPGVKGPECWKLPVMNAIASAPLLVLEVDGPWMLADLKDVNPAMNFAPAQL